MKIPTPRPCFRLSLQRCLPAAVIAASAAIAAIPILAALAAIATLAAVTALLPTAAAADDRDILRDSAARPYVFFLLDTSGSMNWAPPCTQAQYDTFIDHDDDPGTPMVRTCDYVCETGDCPVPRDGDDPASKFRQSREALYEVMRNVEDVDFGFATFNQDHLRVANKHWLYRVAAIQPGGFFSLSGGETFPVAGSEEVFGAGWWDTRGGTCTYAPNNYNNTTTDTHVACFPRRQDGTLPDDNDCEDGGGANTNVCAPADTTDAWEYTRFRRLPRLNANGNTTTYAYLRAANGSRYRVMYGGPVIYGAATISVPTEIALCTNEKCTTVSGVTTRAITYALVGDFVMWDYQIKRTSALTSPAGWFGRQDSTSDNVCAGWDWNEDTPNDQFVAGDPNSNLKYLTVDDPADPDRHATAFDYGDVIPLDWQRDNRLALLNRLAPRLNGADPATDPEAFAGATYLANNRVGSEAFLRLANASQRTLLPSGSTPLGYSLGEFRTWFRGCLNGSCPQDIGWDDIAATSDPTWACRQKFLVVVTDGDDTCSGRDPCSLTASMRAQDGILTYVVAFGAQLTPGNRLHCMASNGGTVEPILPQNKYDLVRALNDILGSIREQVAAFASAAVPQVQANATDKIFLSSFTPVKASPLVPENDASYWAGRLDAYLKPLPLDGQGRPDRSVVCGGAVQGSCFLWDAGDVQEGRRGIDGVYAPRGLLLQAPHPDDLQPVAPWEPADLQIGTAADERRVIYSQFSELGNRRLFTYPVTNAQKYDLWTGFGIPFIAGDATSEATATARANAVVVTTLLEKEARVSIPDPADPGELMEVPLTFLMGDIFHADPLVVSKPANFSYYVGDPYLNKPLCAAAPDPNRFPPVSYKWFADRHVCRRTLLVAGANDGQLHVFDGGLFRALGSTTAECLLPAKDLDLDGVAEVDEWSDGLVDYDLNDEVERASERCSVGTDCESGSCLSGFCAAQACVSNADCDSNLCLANGFCSGGNGVIDGAYDNGSGRELFSFIPRAMLATVAEMAGNSDRNRDFWGLDGGPRIDDVFIDPTASEDSVVTCVDREWRSVAIGGYREGGPGYYALDITQPDTLNNKNVPQPLGGASGYVPSCFDGTSCDNRPYPTVLWEFQDTQPITLVSGVTTVIPLDEDLNGSRDLTNSWSRPTTGRIRICTGSCTPNETEDRFVAIFGGGVGDLPSPETGNFVYMVDIETGKVIYKKPVLGSVAGDIAAIDANGDSYIDRLYFGTVAGFVYKVQLDPATTPMLLQNLTLTTRYFGVDYTFQAERLNGSSAGSPEPRKHDPFQIFSTGGRPIYHELSAIYVATQNRVALAFGTGDRWNLWNFDGQTGRFYVLLDEEFADTDFDGVLNYTCSGCSQPLTESSYVAVDPDAAFDPDNPEYFLFNGSGGSQRGWFLTLTANEKVITEGFSLAGVTIFSSFVPTEVANSDGTCSRAGTSRIFIVGTVTALGYNIPEGGALIDRVRYTEVPQFTTPPFVEQSATANPEGGGSGTQHADYITESLALIRDELKTLQSSRCRYANYTQNIKTIRSDTGLVFVAPIPLCIDPTSWKEF